MRKEKIEDLLKDLEFNEMLCIQINSWELVLQKRGLKEATVYRKVKNLIDFFIHLNSVKLSRDSRIKFNELGGIIFEYVRDGYFGTGENLDNEGTSPYRQNIYHNIVEAINYIYEGMEDENCIIKSLTEDQKEVLNEISRNKWFRVCSVKDDETETFFDSLQVQLIKKMNIKVYFDDNNKPYVLSHELTEVIDKKSDRILKDIRALLSKIGLVKIDESSAYVDMAMIEDFYLNSQNKKQPTYRIYKDLLLMYILGLTGQEIIEFKMKYIGAFNYIEKEYNKMLIENGKLKKSFYEMYNEIRKKNRDLMVIKQNKKAKKKAS